jgi:hypothetical protein
MRILALVSLLAAVSACYGQQAPANPSSPLPTPKSQQAASPNQTITIPAGTRIPLTLVGQITKKSARRGTAVRAVTASPVTVGTQVAIPAGTYIEGVIDSVDKRGPSGPTMVVHFTRIVFSGGYTVSVDGSNMHTRVVVPEPTAAKELDAINETKWMTEANDTNDAAQAMVPSDDQPHVAFASFRPNSEPEFALAAQRSPAQSTGEPPPLKAPGPSIGTVVGISLGTAAAAVVALVVLTHRGYTTSDVLFDTGWQIEMVLATPLTLDATRVASAIAATDAR